MARGHILSRSQPAVMWADEHSCLLHIRHTQLEPCDLRWDCTIFYTYAFVPFCKVRFNTRQPEMFFDPNSPCHQLSSFVYWIFPIKTQSGIECHFLLMTSDEKGWHLLSHCITVSKLLRIWRGGWRLLLCRAVFEYWCVTTPRHVLRGWEAQPSPFSLSLSSTFYISHSRPLRVPILLSSSLSLYCRAKLRGATAWELVKITSKAHPPPFSCMDK